MKVLQYTGKMPRHLSLPLLELVQKGLCFIEHRLTPFPAEDFALSTFLKAFYLYMLTTYIIIQTFRQGQAVFGAQNYFQKGLLGVKIINTDKLN